MNISIFMEGTLFDRKMAEAKSSGENPAKEYAAYAAAYDYAIRSKMKPNEVADAAMGMCNAAHLMKDEGKYADALSKFKAIRLDPGDAYHADALALLSSDVPEDRANAGKAQQYIFRDGKYVGLHIPVGGSKNDPGNPANSADGTEQRAQADQRYDEYSEDLLNAELDANIIRELEKADAEQHDIGILQSVVGFLKGSASIATGGNPINTALYMTRSISIESMSWAILMLQLAAILIAEIATAGAATPAVAAAAAAEGATLTGGKVAVQTMAKRGMGAIARYVIKVGNVLWPRSASRISVTASMRSYRLVDSLKPGFVKLMESLKVVKSKDGSAVVVPAQSLGTIKGVRGMEAFLGGMTGKYSKMFNLGVIPGMMAYDIAEGDAMGTQHATHEAAALGGLTLNAFMKKNPGHAIRSQVFKLYFATVGAAMIVDRLQGLKFWIFYIYCIAAQVFFNGIKLAFNVTPPVFVYKLVSSGFDINAVCSQYNASARDVFAKPFADAYNASGTITSPMAAIANEFKTAFKE